MRLRDTCLRCLAGAVIGLGLATGALADDDPMRTITIDFDSTDTFEESDGKEGTAAAAAMSDEDQAKVVARVQAIYDEALGERKVEVKAGTGGDVEMIVSSGALADEAKYGNAGKPGKPGIVYEDRMDNRYAGGALVNAVANVIAHETGHKLGLSHNWNDRPSIMTVGGKWDHGEVDNDNVVFNDGDESDLEEEICDENESDGEHSDDFCPGDLGVFPGQPLNQLGEWYEDHLNVHIFPKFLPPQAEFGYISAQGAFISTFDPEDVDPTYFTFPYHAGVNLAVGVNGQVFSLCDGFGGYEIFEPNPSNPDVALLAFVFIDTDFGPAQVVLQVNLMDGPVTGGFFKPQPLCLADCDQDGQLTILDFVCFQNLFSAGDPAADCNGDNQLNILDFVCFQNVFVQGCG